MKDSSRGCDSPPGTSEPPGAPSVVERLDRGARWARAQGRHNLGSLLEALAEELATLQEGPDLGGLEPEEIEGRLHALDEAEHEHQIAITDLELDTRALESRVTQIESELSELQEQIDALQAKSRSTRRTDREGA